MDKIIPEGMEVIPASAEIKITKTVETGLVAKAKELLTVPMDSSDLINALEFYCVYGKAPEMKGDRPVISGNFEKKAGYESKHYSSSQLKRIIATVKADLTPKEEPIEEEITK